MRRSIAVLALAIGSLAWFSCGEARKACPSGCQIDGTCYPAGVANPANACLVCDPTSSPTAWTAASGTKCDDGLFCTVLDTCTAGTCAGAPRDCSDGIACDGDETCDEGAGKCARGTTICADGTVCDLATDHCDAACTGCVIDGVCYGDGQRDPLDPCQVCNVALSSRTFSFNEGATCDDGLFCTVDDICTSGTCSGIARNCGDGVACNGTESCDEATDTCDPGTTTCDPDEVCDTAHDACVLTCTGCVIAGVCYGNGQLDPVNPCQLCDTGRSTTAFSNNDDASCDDGLFCTDNDSCTAGSCAGTPRSCDDGVACNGTELCNETTDTCDRGITTCDPGSLCNDQTDTCVPTCMGCVVGGVCYGNGQLDPLNPCRVCDPGRSTTAFSDNDGATCDDGQFCTVDDRCSAGMCAGTSRSCDDGVACNGSETCNEATDTCDRGTTTCDPDELCDASSDRCVLTCTGCIVGGVCYGNGQPDPGNPCRVCNVTLTATAFSANDGATCDDGLFCTVNDTCSAGTCSGSSRSCDDGVACNGRESCNENTDHCDPGTTTCEDDQLCDVQTDSCVLTCTGCIVGGVCYGNGQLDPLNPCRVCNTAASTTVFVNNDGAICDDGLFCTVNDTCSGGACSGSSRSCDDGVACNGSESCNETTDRCAAGTTTCGADMLCDVQTDSCVVTCTGCVIGGVCYGAGQLDPLDSCKVCNPGVSTTAFTDNDGATCDDGLFCTVGDTCSGGTCSGTARDCSDRVACNGAETCNEATDRCDAGTATCGTNMLCDTTTDTCTQICDHGTVCGTSCVDTNNDPNNCGGCGNSPAVGDHVCPASGGLPPACSGGVCGNFSCTGTLTLSFTGVAQVVSVPSCAVTLHVDVRGAQGGEAVYSGGSIGVGGPGGRVTADLPHHPGDTITVFVGGAGGNAGLAIGGGGGFNGGAPGGNNSAKFGDVQAGGGGGGASDIRINGVGLANRVVVAGGGGGGASCTSAPDGADGGGLIGGSPASLCVGAGTLPTGGTQVAGGIGGSFPTYCTAANGTQGNGSSGCSPSAGGGAGGGLYGGGGGAWTGGAGGSSFTTGTATNVVHTRGYQAGNGQVILRW